LLYFFILLSKISRSLVFRTFAINQEYTVLEGFEMFGGVVRTSLAEIIAVITGLASVWFARKENILVYPVGMISVGLYVYLCFQAGLYADMGINAFYFVTGIYGWYKWTHKGHHKATRGISKLSRLEWGLSAATVILLFVVLRYILIRYTDSTVPDWDAITTALFIVGMIQMALKKLENWIIWIIGDVLCIPLFAYKDLWLSGFQYLVFTILAVAGYVEWRKRFLKAANT